MIIGGVSLSLPLGFWGIPALLGLVGLFDDRLKLSVRTRLGVQFVLAGTWVMACWSGEEFSLQSAALAAFWVVFIVGSANFFNFMDGIDGIAGISGAVGFGLLALFGFAQSFVYLAFFCLLVSAASLGFLPFNFPRPRVFMGDVGSVPLGFLFGALVFSMTEGLADFLCLTSFLFLFYADTISTLFIRWSCGERLSQPHRRHLYQLLANELNKKHVSVSLAYGGLQLSIGLLMFFLWQWGLVWQILFLSLLTCGFILTTFTVRRLPHRDNREGAR
jgi:Fuc2NAc and GlcNAc transferase